MLLCRWISSVLLNLIARDWVLHQAEQREESGPRDNLALCFAYRPCEILNWIWTYEQRLNTTRTCASLFEIDLRWIVLYNVAFICIASCKSTQHLLAVSPILLLSVISQGENVVLYEYHGGLQIREITSRQQSSQHLFVTLLEWAEVHTTQHIIRFLRVHMIVMRIVPLSLSLFLSFFLFAITDAGKSRATLTSPWTPKFTSDCARSFPFSHLFVAIHPTIGHHRRRRGYPRRAHCPERYLPFVSLAPPSCTRCTHRGVETDRSAERCIAPPRCRERNTRNVFPFRQRPVVSSSAGWPTIAHHQHVDMRSASSGGPSASASQRDASRRGGASSNQVTEGETAAAWPMLAGAPAYSLSLSLSLSVVAARGETRTTTASVGTRRRDATRHPCASRALDVRVIMRARRIPLDRVEFSPQMQIQESSLQRVIRQSLRRGGCGDTGETREVQYHSQRSRRVDDPTVSRVSGRWTLPLDLARFWKSWSRSIEWTDGIYVIVHFNR